MHVLSTITSPVFSEVVAFYRDYNFIWARVCTQAPWIPPQHYPPLGRRPQAEKEAGDPQHRKRFKVFYEMHKVRDFQLVLCADVWDPVEDYSMHMLKRVVANEKARGGFSDSFSEPLVIYRPRGSRPDTSEYMIGIGRSSRPTAWTPL